MLGILTEKPSAARNFAAALGGMKGVFDGQSYVIVHARGHLYEYEEPAKQVPAAVSSAYKSWSTENLPWDETLFAWKRCRKDGVSSLLSDIKTTLSACDEIAIATDVDPSGEGQLLAWEVLSELKLVRGKTISRFYFTDESAAELQKAFRTRKVLPPMISDPDYKKAEFRSQWDMLSMQFTRIATACAPGRAVLRQGRLKSAMVRIVGDGLQAVKNYKRVPFYQNKFRDDHGVIYTNPDEPRFPSEDQVPQSYSAGTVVCDGKQMKYTAPPRLLDLAGLSARLSSSGYKAKDVLAVYQKMYEAQIVSYPRTEDKTITPEQFNELLGSVDAIAAVVGVDASLLTHRQPRSTHVKPKGAHGANRPGKNVPDSLQSLLTYGACAPAIYEMLAKNYLAMLCEDYAYEQQKGHIAEYPAFKGSASVPKSMGWKQVFDADDGTSDDDNASGLGTTASVFIAEGANPKPPVPTMKWLMSQLEKCDVGTGATRTSTYADVTSDKSKYPLLTETRGKLGMTEFGDMSYQLLADTMIGDVSITEKLQAQMRGIADGTLFADVCLREIRDYVKHDLDVMLRNASAAGFCTNLGQGVGVMVQKEKYSGVWNGKPVSFTRVWSGHRFTDEECEKLCAGEVIVVDGLVSKSGSTYAVTGKLSNLVYNGRKYVGFERTGFANSAAGGGKSRFTNEDGIPYEVCKHKFTEDELEALAAGTTIFVQGFISKAGKKFDANVRFDIPDDADDDCKKIIFEFN